MLASILVSNNAHFGLLAIQSNETEYNLRYNCNSLVKNKFYWCSADAVSDFGKLYCIRS